MLKFFISKTEAMSTMGSMTPKKRDELASGGFEEVSQLEYEMALLIIRHGHAAATEALQSAWRKLDAVPQEAQ